MISYIKGILAEKSPARIVVDAGGVGYVFKLSRSVLIKVTDRGNPHGRAAAF